MNNFNNNEKSYDEKFVQLSNEKQSLINDLNSQFKTILSYETNNDITSVGQFIFKDVITTSEEYSTPQVVLQKIDNPNTQIIMPKILINQYIETALANGSQLDVFNGDSISFDKVESQLSSNLINSDSIQSNNTISLEQNNIVFIKDGEYSDSTNLVLCPIAVSQNQSDSVQNIESTVNTSLNNIVSSEEDFGASDTYFDTAE